MADDSDLASEREEAFRQMCLQAVPRPMGRGNGVCQWCDRRIEKDRLDAVPMATYCAECAADIEDAIARNHRRGI